MKFDANGDVSASGTSPRANFDNFLHGLTTVYIVLIGDDWNLIMYDHVRTVSPDVMTVTFFVSVVILGNWILLNLFLAILLSNFEDEKEIMSYEEIKLREQEKKKKSVVKSVLKSLGTFMRKRQKPTPIEDKFNVAQRLNTIEDRIPSN